jgi:hypothetical protein
MLAPHMMHKMELRHSLEMNDERNLKINVEKKRAFRC